MRMVLHPALGRHRIRVGPLASDDRCGACGSFLLPGPAGMTLKVVASDGSEWPFDPPAWEHVSVSTARRCPTWAEMEWVRDLFWSEDETVILLSVPRAEHLNCHPYCLHMWRPIGVEIPRPPALTVGPPAEAPR